MYNGVQRCTTVYNGVQRCTTVYNGVQRCTTVYNGIQRCTTECIVCCQEDLKDGINKEPCPICQKELSSRVSSGVSMSVKWYWRNLYHCQHLSSMSILISTINLSVEVCHECHC